MNLPPEDSQPEAEAMIRALLGADETAGVEVSDAALLRFATGLVEEEEEEAVLDALTTYPAVRARMLELRDQVVASGATDRSFLTVIAEAVRNSAEAMSEAGRSFGDWIADGRPAVQQALRRLGRQIAEGTSGPRLAITRGPAGSVRIDGQVVLGAQFSVTLDEDGALIATAFLPQFDKSELHMLASLGLRLGSAIVTEGRWALAVPKFDRTELEAEELVPESFELRSTSESTESIAFGDRMLTLVGTPRIESGVLLIKVAGAEGAVQFGLALGHTVYWLPETVLGPDVLQVSAEGLLDGPIPTSMLVAREA